MLWYIISSQLVTLGLLLHNAHIRQHYHAVYICRDGGGRLFVDVYIYTHELLIAMVMVFLFVYVYVIHP